MDFYLGEGKQLSPNSTTLILVCFGFPKNSLLSAIALIPSLLCLFLKKVFLKVFFLVYVLQFSAGSVDRKCRTVGCGSVNLVAESGKHRLFRRSECASMRWK